MKTSNKRSRSTISALLQRLFFSTSRFSLTSCSRWRSRAVAFAALILICVLVAPAQTLPQCDSTTFLLTIGERTTDMSPSGINNGDWMVVLPDGRFHLERRVQQLPSATNTLTVYESSLSVEQLHHLHDLLESDSLKKLSQYVQPAIPIDAPWYGLVEAKISRDTGIQHVGYWAWLGGKSGASPNSAPDEVKKGWREAQSVLEPLLSWFHMFKASDDLKPMEKERASLCAY